MELDLDEDEDDKEDGFNMDTLLEALPAMGVVVNVGAISESLLEMEGV